MNAMLGRGAQAIRPEEYNAMLRASHHPFGPQHGQPPADPAYGPRPELIDPWNFIHELDRQRWMDEIYQPQPQMPDPEDQFRPRFRPLGSLTR